jgi:hypothetical protein
MSLKSRVTTAKRFLLLSLAAAALIALLPTDSRAGEYYYRPCGDANNNSTIGLRQWEYEGDQVYGLRAECKGAFYQYLQYPTASVNGPGIRWLPLGPGQLTSVHFTASGRDRRAEGLDFAAAICNGPDFPDDCGTPVRGASDYPYAPVQADLTLENHDFPPNADRLVLYVNCTLDLPDLCDIGTSHTEFFDFMVFGDDVTPPEVNLASAPSTSTWFNHVPDPEISAYDPESGIGKSVVTANEHDHTHAFCGGSDTLWGCPNGIDPFVTEGLSLVQGSNHIEVETFNSASLQADRAFNFLYDDVSPGAPAGLTIAGMKNGWVKGHSLQLNWANLAEELPTDTESGIASATVKLEPAHNANPAQYPKTLTFDGTGLSSATVTVPWEDRWTIRVSVTDAAGNSSEFSPLAVEVEDSLPGLPTFWDGPTPVLNIANTASPVTLKWLASIFGRSGDCGYRGWIGKGTPPELSSDPSSQVSGSGVRSWTIGLAGLSKLSDGVNTLAVAAVDCAGLAGENGTADVLVDRVRPLAWLDPDSRWLPSAGALTLNASDSSGGSGVDSAWYTLETGPTHTTVNSSSTVPLTNGRHTVTYGSTDKAGNPSIEHVAQVGVDPTPPAVSIEPVAGTPGSFTARASDAISGVVDAWSEISSASGGDWRRIGDRFHSATGELSTVTLGLRVPDDGSLAAGDYNLRVVSSDEAGNVQTAALRTIRLPLRPATTITAAIASAAHPKAVHPSITLNVGQKAVLSGILRDARGTGVGGVPLRVVAQRQGGGGKRVIDNPTTKSDGSYTLDLGTDVSRTLTVYYDGNGERGPVLASVAEYVRADVSLRMSAKSLRRGGRLFAKGRVALLSAAVPAEGVPVEIQFCGRVTCSTLAVKGYTDSSGGFRLAIPTSYSVRTKLILRARVGKFPGWPFAEGFSARRSVIVR